MGQIFFVMFFIALLVWLAYLSEKKPKKKILFFGDSITEQGAKAGGYISILESMLQDASIKKFTLIASGIGGNTISDLYNRMDTDVLGKSPDIVVLFAGVNDVWRKRISGVVTDQVEFAKTYQTIIDSLQQNSISILACTPAVIGERKDGDNGLDEQLELVCSIIRNIAVAAGIPLLDLRKIFLTYESENNHVNLEKGVLTTDGVHLNFSGNELVANKLFKLLTES